MKIAIIGSRDYADLDAVREYVANLPADTEVVSGGARGVDDMAMIVAKERGLKWLVFQPDFEQYGFPAAYHVRNRQIVDYSDEVVAFWNGKSRGTRGAVEYARKKGKLREVIQ